MFTLLIQQKKIQAVSQYVLLFFLEDFNTKYYKF